MRQITLFLLVISAFLVQLPAQKVVPYSYTTMPSPCGSSGRIAHLRTGSGSSTVYAPKMCQADGSWSNVGGSGSGAVVYSSTKTITFPAASGSTQANITLGFTATGTIYRTVANGGQIQNTVTRNGQVVPVDFLLTSDSTCSSIQGYRWNIESYNPTTGSLVGWVLVPSLSSSSSSVVTVCIGNAGATTYHGGVVGSEFDSNTLAVYHLSNSSSLGLDETGAGNNLSSVSSVSAATGKLANAVFVDAGGYMAGSPVSSFPEGTSQRTVEVWSRKDSGSGTDQGVFGYGSNSAPLRRFMVGHFGGNGMIEAGSYATVTSLWSLDGLWHHIAGVLPSGATNLNQIQMYFDGAPVANTGESQTLDTLATEIGLGQIPTVGAACCTLTGYVDEARISRVARSADWIASEYANQNNPPSVQ